MAGQDNVPQAMAGTPLGRASLEEQLLEHKGVATRLILVHTMPRPRIQSKRESESESGSGPPFPGPMSNLDASPNPNPNPNLDPHSPAQLPNWTGSQIRIWISIPGPKVQFERECESESSLVPPSKGPRSNPGANSNTNPNLTPLDLDLDSDLGFALSGS